MHRSAVLKITLEMLHNVFATLKIDFKFEKIMNWVNKYFLLVFVFC